MEPELERLRLEVGKAVRREAMSRREMLAIWTRKLVMEVKGQVRVLGEDENSEWRL